MSQFNNLGAAVSNLAGFLPPVTVSHNGRIYHKLQQDPLAGEVHGLPTLVAWDEYNEEYLLLDGGSPYLDWCSTIEEEAEHHDFQRFETIAALVNAIENPED